jgi:hypothetical protein
MKGGEDRIQTGALIQINCEVACLACSVSQKHIFNTEAPQASSNGSPHFSILSSPHQ